MHTSDEPAVLFQDVRIGAGGPVGSVRVAGGRVVEVGPSVRPEADDVVLDSGGATLLPGLWDCHVHAVQWALARRRLDVSTARSAADAAAASAAAAKEGETLVGYGFRDATWPDAPHKDLLDALAPGRAIVLVSNDLHTAWLSSAALRIVGAGEHADGVLREQDCYRAVAALPPPPQAALDAWVAEATTAAAARGVVGLVDFEYADNVSDWSRRAARYRIDTRVVCSIPADRLAEAIAAGVRTGEGVPDTGGLVTVGPVKIFVDGSLNTRTAYCADPYPAASQEPYGRLETPPDRLRAILAEASRHGVSPAVHAIGDRAVSLALDAFEAVDCGGRIEHAQLVSRADLRRFARANLVASVQPAHGPDDRDVADQHWAGRTDRAFAYLDLLEAGARMEFGSDAPVAALDPWDGIASAVTRTDDDRPAWHPEQALGVLDALAASSRGRRSVAVGDPADLVLVEQDPAAIEHTALREVTVLATVLGGRFTYRAAAL